MRDHKSIQLNRLLMTRIVAKPEALDRAQFEALSLRVAPDELYVQADVKASSINDDYAIITKEASLSGVWLHSKDALYFLEHECAWELPKKRPAFAQGMVAHLPVKLYFEKDRVLMMTAAPFAHDLEARLKGFIT